MRLCCYLATPGGMTGAPRRLVMLCRSLPGDRIKPIIVADSSSQLVQEAEVFGIETIAVDLPRALEGRRRALFRRGIGFRLKLIVALCRQTWRVGSAYRRAEANMVWVRGSKGFLFGGLGALLLGRRLVWDVDYELPSTGIMRILHWVAIQASAVVVFQYRDAPRVIFGEDWAARYASRFHAILPGVDTDALAAAADMRRRRLSRRPGDRFRILQVGTICERKNQRFLVGLLARMTREYEFDQWSLELIYDENQDEGFQSLLEELGISARVKLLGWRTDAAELMADADVLAMPSLDEGVPNAAQEAMVIGVPVIASRAGGLPEILNGQAGGWSIPLEEESEWIEVLRRCEMDPQLCERVGSEGREFAVGAFRSEHWGEQYADVMDKGSAGAGPRGEFDG